MEIQRRKMNKVMITIIIIIGVILSVFPVSQIIKECNGQNPRIEKLESPSSINNPFKKDCITDIIIFKRMKLSGEYYYAGYVNFENGNTIIDLVPVIIKIFEVSGFINVDEEEKIDVDENLK